MTVERDAVFEVPTVIDTADWAYGPPNVPVLVSGTETIRVLLGTVDPEEADKPDLFIERRRNGWVIAIHPTNGDPCGIVYFLDGGETFLVAEGIRVVDDGAPIAEKIDAMPTEPTGDWAEVDAIRQRLAATGRAFADSADLIREDRDR